MNSMAQCSRPQVFTKLSRQHDGFQGATQGTQVESGPVSKAQVRQWSRKLLPPLGALFCSRFRWFLSMQVVSMFSND